ncbi:hypothetical protein [Spirulina sp. CCNP1310]|uniref:hypothetical protein n=1 Tax=Spirulina sp. CCNP1310 TaxID=3110249 RepID=UPI002B1F8B8B|nr:hypothetical protein [Spirulina sp. CCNP1310]
MDLDHEKHQHQAYPNNLYRPVTFCGIGNYHGGVTGAMETHFMDVKLILVVLTGVFILTTLFFGTKNGFYDSDDYHGNGSAH